MVDAWPVASGPQDLHVPTGQLALTAVSGRLLWLCGDCVGVIGSPLFRPIPPQAGAIQEIVEVQMGDGWAYYRADDGRLIYKVDNPVTEELRGLGHLVITEEAGDVNGPPPPLVDQLYELQIDATDAG